MFGFYIERHRMQGPRIAFLAIGLYGQWMERRRLWQILVRDLCLACRRMGFLKRILALISFVLFGNTKNE